MLSKAEKFSKTKFDIMYISGKVNINCRNERPIITQSGENLATEEKE